MEDAAVFTRNPWTDDDRSLGYVKDVLFLAEKTGHIQKVGLTLLSLVYSHRVTFYVSLCL